MQLKDTVEMMCSPDYVERFKAEFKQLEIRKDKLGEMLEKYKNGELDFEPKSSYEVLFLQIFAMSVYETVLKMRAEEEEIEL